VTETPEIGPNRYGKQAIRLVKVVRGAEHHDVRDLTVGVTLEGDFAASYTGADNSLVIATDTMKNTVYAFAPEHLTGSIEAFGLVLGRHFVEASQVERATITIAEHGWERLIGAHGRPVPDAFRRSGGATRTASVAVTRDGEAVESGVTDLVVMKTTKSAFSGFPRDRYTTLPEVSDRLLATKVTSTWRHAAADVDWESSYTGVLATLLEVFADHHSESVQHSIWLMGRAILDRHPGIDEVRMRLPNLHHWLVDLAPFGGANAGEVFVATTEPHGLIEATVRRGTPAP
jgi:urate oxidase